MFRSSIEPDQQDKTKNHSQQNGSQQPSTQSIAYLNDVLCGIRRHLFGKYTACSAMVNKQFHHLAAVLLSSLAFSAQADNIQYCPQQITCVLNAGGGIDCPAMPTGWHVTGTAASGGNFLPGTYKFDFSFAQSFSSAESNCNYVTKSNDTNSKLIVLFSNGSWKAADVTTSKWIKTAEQTYCYSAGLFYSKVNDAMGCPFNKL